jgi:hypothetical protein
MINDIPKDKHPLTLDDVIRRLEAVPRPKVDFNIVNETDERISELNKFCDELIECLRLLKVRGYLWRARGIMKD